jgi:hypothetical protein
MAVFALWSSGCARCRPLSAMLAGIRLSSSTRMTSCRARLRRWRRTARPSGCPLIRERLPGSRVNGPSGSGPLVGTRTLATVPVSSGANGPTFTPSTTPSSSHGTPPITGPFTSSFTHSGRTLLERHNRAGPDERKGVGWLTCGSVLVASALRNSVAVPNTQLVSVTVVGVRYATTGESVTGRKNAI